LPVPSLPAALAVTTPVVASYSQPMPAPSATPKPFEPLRAPTGIGGIARR
jgi:hypothetical protein